MALTAFPSRHPPTVFLTLARGSFYLGTGSWLPTPIGSMTRHFPYIAVNTQYPSTPIQGSPARVPRSALRKEVYTSGTLMARIAAASGQFDPRDAFVWVWLPWFQRKKKSDWSWSEL